LGVFFAPLSSSGKTGKLLIYKYKVKVRENIY
jgi:hypothetical protein